MGFFNEIGRRVEQFKRTAQKTAEESANYRCRACDARFNAYDDQCPNCGETEIARTDAEE